MHVSAVFCAPKLYTHDSLACIPGTSNLSAYPVISVVVMGEEGQPNFSLDMPASSYFIPTNGQYCFGELGSERPRAEGGDCDRSVRSASHGYSCCTSYWPGCDYGRCVHGKFLHCVRQRKFSP